MKTDKEKHKIAVANMITEELKTWLIRQTKTQQPPRAVLESMKKSGWKEDDALLAIEMVLQQQLTHMHDGKERPNHPAPYIDIDPHKPQFDLGLAWSPSLVQFIEKPYVAVIENFLSETECQMLIDLARPRMERSTVIDYEGEKSGNGKVIEARSSNGMFFRRGEQLLLEEIENRIAKLTHWPVEYGEGIQILNYHPGGEYKAHHDYFDLARMNKPEKLGLGNQRVGTFLMYLHEPIAGGATEFTDVKFSVSPRRGTALFFNYPIAETASLTLHAGLPVIEGEKWIATKWLRDGFYNS